MKRTIYFLTLICLSIGVSSTFGQNGVSDKTDKIENTITYKLLKTKENIAKMELKNLREVYTEISTNVQNKKFEMDLIGIEKAKLLLVDSSNFCRLNETYGALVINKVALEVELKQLLADYTLQSPIVKEQITNLREAEQKVEKYLL